MNTLKSTVVVAALVAATGGAMLAGGASAFAATYAPYGTPTPWAPGGVDNDTNAVGGLTFYNAAGTPITSGSTNTAPFAAYAVGSRNLRTTDNLSATFLYTPQKGVDPSQWNGKVLGPSSTFPNTSAPAPVNGYTTPTTTGASNDLTLESVSDSQTTSSDAGYANVFEVRQLTAKQRAGQSTTYNYADVLIDQNTHTWTEVWTPEQIAASPAASTTSTLTSSPTTVTVNNQVTLTDQVAANTGTAVPAGTVQFKDGGTNLGSPVTLDSTGTATAPFTPATVGDHAVTAVFAPTDTTKFGASTGTVTVTATKVNQKATNVALVANPTSGPALSNVTLTATTTDQAAGTPVDGTVSFFDGTTQIGSKATTNGSAAITYSNFTQGDHPNITVQFTPTDTATYGSSTSAAIDFNANSAPVDTTRDPQNIDAQVGAGALSITTPYHANNPLHVGTLKLNAAATELTGSAQFGDATTNGSIDIVDTRSGGANWTASASSSNLTDAASDVINQQNVGLTGLTGIYTAGNALQAGSLTLSANPAADPAVAPAASGTQGLGGGAHAFAQTKAGGTGTVGVYGTLTVNAPTSTKAGTYAGIITFTVA